MAITWNWNEQCGTATFEQTFKGKTQTFDVSLYVGNCFLIMIYEYNEDGEDKYQLQSFFADADHMERCLKDDIFTGYSRLVSIKINKAKCRNYKQIISLLAEYMDITIEVYTEGEYTWREHKKPKQTISDLRMREIAEKAVWALYSNSDDWEEEFDDADLDLTDEEKEYFGIEEERDEEI